MTTPVKFSLIDAARIALVSDPVPSTPARDRTLAAASVMWCRELTIPTVRRLAAEVGRSPVTVLQPFGRLIHIYAEVIRREWAELEAIAGLESAERSTRLARHVAGLELVDPVLGRLPTLVEAAVVAAQSSTKPALPVAPLAWSYFRFDDKEAM